MNVDKIREIAHAHGWTEADHQENIKMISFRSEGCRINVYYSKMTVATSLNHPKYGSTQLFRKHVWDAATLAKIFDNPRVHLDTGYFYRDGGHPPKIKKVLTATPSKDNV